MTVALGIVSTLLFTSLLFNTFLWIAFVESYKKEKKLTAEVERYKESRIEHYKNFIR